MNNDNSLILDEIKENSQIGYAKDINILNKLLEGIWCEEKDLIDAYNIVTQNNNINDTVIILLQLPFLVKLPEKWIKVKSEYGTPYIKFRPIGTIYNKLNSQEEFFIKQRYDYKDFDHFQNGYLENDFYGLLTKTQVLVSFSGRGAYCGDIIGEINEQRRQRNEMLSLQ